MLTLGKKNKKSKKEEIEEENRIKAEKAKNREATILANLK